MNEKFTFHTALQEAICKKETLSFVSNSSSKKKTIEIVEIEKEPHLFDVTNRIKKEAFSSGQNRADNLIIDKNGNAYFIEIEVTHPVTLERQHFFKDMNTNLIVLGARAFKNEASSLFTEKEAISKISTNAITLRCEARPFSFKTQNMPTGLEDLVVTSVFTRNSSVSDCYLLGTDKGPVKFFATKNIPFSVEKKGKCLCFESLFNSEFNSTQSFYDNLNRVNGILWH